MTKPCGSRSLPRPEKRNVTPSAVAATKPTSCEDISCLHSQSPAPPGPSRCCPNLPILEQQLDLVYRANGLVLERQMSRTGDFSAISRQWSLIQPATARLGSPQISANLRVLQSCC